MLLSSFGMFEQNEDINAIYKNTKQNLLPAMLFLMLLQVDIRDFFKLGKSLLIAYALALFSLSFGFIAISLVFDFSAETASALDIAFVSLHVKQTEQTFSEYFGIKNITPVKTDVTISLNSVDVMLEDAKKAFSERKEILKVKVGSDILHAADIVRKIAKELPHAKILVDANQAWNFEDTHFFINNMLGLKIELIEQPTIASDLESLKKITEFSYVPILADEAVFTLRDAKKVVESKSADMINIKFMKCGGVTKAVEILEYARENSVKCMLGSILEGPYSINIALYLAFAYRDVVRYVDLDSPLLYKEPSSELNFEFKGCEILFKK